MERERQDRKRQRDSSLERPRKRSKRDDRDRSDSPEYTRSNRGHGKSRSPRGRHSQDRSSRRSRERRSSRSRDRHSSSKHSKRKHREKEDDAERKKMRRMKKEAKRFIKQHQAENEAKLAEVRKGLKSGKLPELSAKTHYYSHHAEFRRWVSESVDDVDCDELDTATARKLFSDFADAWNRAKLNPTFYLPDTGRVEAASRTRHQWNIRLDDKEQDRIASAQLLDKRGGERSYHVGARSGDADRVGYGLPSSGSSGAGAPRSQTTLEREEAYSKLRAERKQFNKRHNAVLDELVPKPEPGREAQREKRRQKGAYTRQEEMSPDRGDSFLMGSSSNDFKSMVRQQSDRQARRGQRRNEELDAKREEHRAAEEKKMAAFRAMAESGNFPLLTSKR